MAGNLATRFGAKIEGIDTGGAFEGFGSYFRGIFASVRHSATPIKPPKYDPSQFDIILIIGPLWAGNISCPVRGYLTVTVPHIGRYAAFITSTEGKPDRAFEQLGQIIGHAPVAIGSVAIRDVLGKTWEAKVDAFAATVETAMTSF